MHADSDSFLSSFVQLAFKQRSAADIHLLQYLSTHQSIDCESRGADGNGQSWADVWRPEAI